MNRSQSSHRGERQPIAAIVAQHVEDAAHLRDVRSVLVRRSDILLAELARHDERIAAHLDGIAVAGQYGASLVDRALERTGVGEIFVGTVRAIEDRDAARLDKLLDVSEAILSSRSGLLSAFGWVSAASLTGIAKPLMQATRPWRREVALAACAMHAVDPGQALTLALRDDDPSLRARALRAVGQCGRRDLADICLSSCGDPEPSVALEAARAALFLGDRHDSLATLESIAMIDATRESIQLQALLLVLKVVPPTRAQSLLATIARRDAQKRTLIQCIASAGDPHYVPWLIAQMEDAKLARLAGEAFSTLTGLDLASLDLQREPPERLDTGPNDDPNDGLVAMDQDEGLPWPHGPKVDAWWKVNGSGFTPGCRYFMGDPLAREKCLHVLKTGRQRQRVAAAEHSTLLHPGTQLFNVFAPGWRQQRMLAARA